MINDAIYDAQILYAFNHEGNIWGEERTATSSSDIWIRIRNKVLRGRCYSYSRPMLRYDVKWWLNRCALRGIILYIEYTDWYHSACPFIWIGSLHPLPRKRVCLPPRTQRGGATLACGWGVGGPNSDDWTERLYNRCLLSSSFFPSNL